MKHRPLLLETPASGIALPGASGFVSHAVLALVEQRLFKWQRP